MIPIIELSGSYQEIGHKFGSEYKSKIKEFAKTRMARLQSFVKRYGKINVTEQEVLDIANSLLSIHEQYDSNIWQEFSAIAKGADISLEWLLVANAYTDLRDYVCKLKGFNDIEVRFEGCTGFVLDKTMTADNNTIIGQTWDMSVEAMDYLVIVKKNPDNGPKMTYLTTMGGMGLLGINEHGLAIGTTNLMANDSKPGVNYLFTITKALMADNYGSMVDDIIKTNRLSGHSFLCAAVNTKTNTNQGCLLETSATDYINFPSDHYPLVRTNNYSDAMRKYEIFIPEARRRNSVFRYSRALSLLVDKPKWTEKELWDNILSDTYRSNSGAAICNEDYTAQYSEFATLATAILLPHKQQIWLCRGGGANGEVQVVGL